MNRRSRLHPFRRSGCMTCKNRHKKCDEQKPRCGRCTRLDLECKPSELFRSSSLSGSKVQKPSGVSFIQDASFFDQVMPDDNVEETIDSLINDSDDATTYSATTPSISCLEIFQPQLAMTIAEPQTPEMQGYLLHHYINRLSPVLVNVDNLSNPLRTVVIPRAAASPVLMNALNATSAFHVFVCSRDPEFRTASLAYYDKAASGLHRLLLENGGQTNGSQLEILLLISVFLCKYEIISGGVSNWRSHLQGLQKMFALFKSQHSTMAPETVSYVQSFIAYHSHIAGITRVERLPSPLMSSADQPSDGSASLDHHIDPYMGVSGNFISLLHLAAETVMLDFTKEANLSIMMSNVLKIYNEVKRPMRTSSTSKTLEQQLGDTIDPLDHIANAYRNALVAYMHNILDAAEESAKADDFIFQCSRIRWLFGATKDEAVSACMRDILLVPEDDSCVVGLVPVLFIVASETKNRTEFDVAIAKLTALLNIAGLANISSALELFHKVQQASSTHWRQIVKGCQWDLIVC